jgi:hypothetical protein
MPSRSYPKGWSFLRPYQQEDALSLAERRAVGLWCPPGVGKSACALSALQLANITWPALIVTKSLGRGVWPRDARWVLGTDFMPGIVDGLAPRRGVDLYDVGVHPRAGWSSTSMAPQSVVYSSVEAALERHQAVVVSYEVMERPDLWDVRWGAFILDESHAVKGGYLPTRKRVRKTDGKLGWTGRSARYELCKAMAEEVHRHGGPVWELTATPVPDRRRDLFGQLNVVLPRMFPKGIDFLKRYCLAPETPVLLSSGVYKSAGQLCAGDAVLGWSKPQGRERGHRGIRPATVVAVTTRQAERWRLDLEDGSSVVCTRDHMWFAGGYEQGSVSEYRPTLSDVGHRDRTGHGRLAITRLLRVFPSAVDAPDIEDVRYMTGYVRGLVDGDGCVLRRCLGKAKRQDRLRYHHRVVVAMKDKVAVDRFVDFCAKLDMNFRRRFRAYDGLHEAGSYCENTYRFFVHQRPGKDRLFWAGWLAGMMDAEGAADANLICQFKSDKKIHFITRALSLLGFSPKRHPSGVCFAGGVKSYISFWIKTRPVVIRKLQHRLAAHAPGITGQHLHIDRRTALGVGPVVTVTTSAGNFFADGLASKNCDLKMKTIFAGGQARDVMDSTGKSNSAELKEVLSRYFIVRTREEIASQLPRMQLDVQVVPPNETSVRFLGGDVETAIARAAAVKLPAALEVALDYLLTGGKVVLTTVRRELAHEIDGAIQSEKFLKQLPRHVRERVFIDCVTGEVPATERMHRLEAFNEMTGRPAILSATSDCLLESIDLHYTHALIVLGLPYTPGQIEQLLGRFSRLGGIPVNVVFLVAEGTIDERIKELVLDKLVDTVALGTDTQGGEHIAAKLKIEHDETAVMSGLLAWVRQTEVAA